MGISTRSPFGPDYKWVYIFMIMKYVVQSK